MNKNLMLDETAPDVDHNDRIEVLNNDNKRWHGRLLADAALVAAAKAYDAMMASAEGNMPGWVAAS